MHYSLVLFVCFARFIFSWGMRSGDEEPFHGFHKDDIPENPARTARRARRGASTSRERVVPYDRRNRTRSESYDSMLSNMSTASLEWDHLNDLRDARARTDSHIIL